MIHGKKITHLKISDLELWDEANVRKHEPMENIGDLVGSIKKNGIFVPLLVAKNGKGGKYRVFSGQRRLMAGAKAGLDTVPCIVFESIRLPQARILSLSENLYRLSMDYTDKSTAANHLLAHFKSRERVARALGVSVQTVKNYLGYQALPDKLKEMVAAKKISSTMAVEIYSKFPDDRCMEFAKALADIPIMEKKKRSGMSEVLRAAKKTDSIGAIRKKAESIERGVKYTILLPKLKSKTVEDMAGVRFATKEEIATEMLLDSIERYERGEW